ncbi:MAG: hypothetical protein IPO09_03385 [Anaeromyxobacter sp.]|nr:hypothetical protein [Anaeromyxobacter sp.]MBL0275628.1 hypothetical protein [Anaeromyxobacter sp.]
MRRPLAAASILLLLLLGPGCSRCGAPASSPPPERWVPASATGALLVPRLDEASRQAAALYATLSDLPGGEELRGLRAGLSVQLGFDPLDPAALAGAGLDPARGLAVAELAPRDGQAAGAPLLVLPVGDAAAFDALVARLARDRLGAGTRGLENANGTPLEVWRRAPGEAALLSVARVERTALVAAGPGGPDALRAALALDPALSLEQGPTWRRARAALGEGPSILFYLPPGGAAPAGLPGGEGLVAGLSAAARSLRLSAAALLGAQESLLAPLAGGPVQAAPLPLDPDTVLALRLWADPAALLALGERTLGLAPPAEVRGVIEALRPPLDVGLSLSPRAELAAALASRGQLDPARVLRAEVVARIKAGARLAPLLDGLARGAHGVVGDGRWAARVGQAEVAWALRGETLAVTAGAGGGLDALLARVAGGPGFAAPSPAGAAALAGGLGGAVLHGANLVKAIRALPPEAYGSGPDAVVTRSLAEKVTSPGASAGALSLRVDLPAGALRLTLDVELGEPARTP